MIDPLRIVLAGEVDHGKSTLIARLLADTGNLPDGKVEEIRAAAERRGVPFEWSFVLDALQGERDQAVTIDTTRRWLRLPKRDLVLVDAPGHEHFLRNMASGASNADAALLVVDAGDGITAQTKRHVLTLELLGVATAVVAVNKMDRVAFDRERFEAIRAEAEAVLHGAGIAAPFVVPVAARDGENVVSASARLPWYAGPPVLAALEGLPARVEANADAPLRLAVQGVLRRGEERVVLGRISAGTLHEGDDVVVLPGARRERIARLRAWPDRGVTSASADASVAFTLAGPTFVERGDVVAARDASPVQARRFRARVLWLSPNAARAGASYDLRIGTRATGATLRTIERVIDVATLRSDAAEAIANGSIADAIFETREPIALESSRVDGDLGRFVLADRDGVAAGGVVLEPLAEERHLVAPDHTLDARSRAARMGHVGAVVWLTGLPSSGKSTLAIALEQRLFDRGAWPVVLDGDELRAGLNADLGFAPADRAENVRRTSEVASLFARAGAVALVALVSPFAADRAKARAAAKGPFFEIYVRADAETCAARDRKGHYAQARAGTIANFTGVTAGYEPPQAPDLIVDTQAESIASCAALLEAFVLERIAPPA